MDRACRVKIAASAELDQLRKSSSAARGFFRRRVGAADNTEARARPTAGVGRAQTGADVLLSLALEMKGDLVVELALDAAGRRQRANAQEEIADIHSAHASFITRPMAVDMRSHSPASTASCRRPGTVSL
jgi:hypothetical protein